MRRPLLERVRSLWDPTRPARGDQSEALRGSGSLPRMAHPSQALLDRALPVQPGGRVVCVTSGKGGTGKSTVSVNLATQLAQEGHRVTLIDADLGLANAHLLLGVTPTSTLLDLLERNTHPDDVALATPCGPRLLSGGSGMQEIAALTPAEIFRLIRKLERLRRADDFVVIDTSAGISPQTLLFLYAAREIVVVVTPDLTSLTDGYAVIKTLLQRSRDFRVSLLVNRCQSAAQARRVFERIRGVTEKYVGAELVDLGFLKEDSAALAAASERRPVVLARSESSLARGLRIVTRRYVQTPATSLELPHAIRQVLPEVDGDADKRRGRGKSRARLQRAQTTPRNSHP